MQTLEQFLSQHANEPGDVTITPVRTSYGLELHLAAGKQPYSLAEFTISDNELTNIEAIKNHATGEC